MSQCTKADALAVQVGGGHYKTMKIQPVEFAMANRWDFCASSALKYILRHASKNGRQDLEKALHFVELREGLHSGWKAAEVIDMQDFIIANAVPKAETTALLALAQVVAIGTVRAYLELKTAIEHLIVLRYGVE